MVTAGAESTVTDELTAGIAVIVGFAPPVVPASVAVTVRTHAAVVLVGAYDRAAPPEFENPGQLPDFTDQT